MKFILSPLASVRLNYLILVFSIIVSNAHCELLGNFVNESSEIFRLQKSNQIIFQNSILKISESRSNDLDTLPAIYYGTYRGIYTRIILGPDRRPEYNVTLIIKNNEISIAEYFSGFPDVIFLDGKYTIEKGSTFAAGKLNAKFKSRLVAIDYSYKSNDEIKLYIKDWCNEMGISLKKEIETKKDLAEKSVPITNSDNVIYFSAVEHMPEPIGGLKTIQTDDKNGKVYLLVYIDESGNVNKAEIVKSMDAKHDEIAQKIILETKFIPGKQRGKPVPVQVTIPVYFEQKNP